MGNTMGNMMSFVNDWQCPCFLLMLEAACGTTRAPFVASRASRTRWPSPAHLVRRVCLLQFWRCALEE